MEILAIIIPVIVVAAAILMFATLRRRDADSAMGTLSRETRQRDAGPTATASSEIDVVLAATGRDVEKAATLARRETGDIVKAETSAVAQWTPPDEEEMGVNRRKFLNRAIIGYTAFSTGVFGLGAIGFLWPPFVTGFGAKVNMGTIPELLGQIGDSNGFLYKPEARAWITAYPAGAKEKAATVYSGPELAGMNAGVVALFQKCPHLGCRVPECITSQWFECPCHGSKYNRVGEKTGGPAPRGMDRFGMSITDKNELIVDTGQIIQGPPIGTNTTGQEAEGPNCIGEASH